MLSFIKKNIHDINILLDIILYNSISSSTYLIVNIFPFEPPPYKAVSDFYTLATGGAGIPEVQKPESFSIDKAIAAATDIVPAVENLDFAVPSLNTPTINLNQSAISNLTAQGQAAISAQDKLLGRVSQVTDDVNEALDNYG